MINPNQRSILSQLLMQPSTQPQIQTMTTQAPPMAQAAPAQTPPTRMIGGIQVRDFPRPTAPVRTPTPRRPEPVRRSLASLQSMFNRGG